jgi:hypothetical protein
MDALTEPFPNKRGVHYKNHTSCESGLNESKEARDGLAAADCPAAAGPAPSCGRRYASSNGVGFRRVARTVCSSLLLKTAEISVSCCTCSPMLEIFCFSLNEVRVSARGVSSKVGSVSLLFCQTSTTFVVRVRTCRQRSRPCTGCTGCSSRRSTRTPRARPDDTWPPFRRRPWDGATTRSPERAVPSILAQRPAEPWLWFPGLVLRRRPLETTIPVGVHHNPITRPKRQANGVSQKDRRIHFTICRSHDVPSTLSRIPHWRRCRRRRSRHCPHPPLTVRRIRSTPTLTTIVKPWRKTQPPHRN